MGELTTPKDGLKTFLYKIQSQFESLCVNKEMHFESEAEFAIQLLSKNSYLMSVAKNNRISLQNAVKNIASIGLTLNPAVGLAYLVPRKAEVCLDISYLGLMKLAQDAGSIKDIKAEVVYSADEFTINGSFKEPTHKFLPFADRGTIVGAYVTATTPEGSFLTTTMPIKEIFDIRDSSESYKNEKTRPYSPWVKHESEMIKKTVIRRAFKSWPKTERHKILNDAIGVSDNAQGIEFKSEYQLEQEQLDKDFPIPPEEKEIGAPTYRVQYGSKFRGKQLKDIDTSQMEDYLITLDKRHAKKDNVPKQWELDLKHSMEVYLDSIENGSDL